MKKKLTLHRSGQYICVVDSDNKTWECWKSILHPGNWNVQHRSLSAQDKSIWKAIKKAKVSL